MKKWIALGILVTLFVVFFAFDLGQFLTLEYFRAIRGDVLDYVGTNPAMSRLGFFVIYIVVTALSLPGAAIMTLAGGAIFGLVWGVVLASFASSIGATLAFLISRSILGNWVQSRFGTELAGINAGIERDGGFYLFGLRMVPLIPFFVVNIVMGVTRMSAPSFYVVSQAGMLASTAVFVFAGTQLGQIETAADILSPGLIIALSMLGLFPLVAKKLMDVLKAGRERA